MSTSVVKWSVVKCSECFSNRVSNTITRYINLMKLLLTRLFRLSHSFIIFWFHFLSLYIHGLVFCIFCLIL